MESSVNKLSLDSDWIHACVSSCWSAPILGWKDICAESGGRGDGDRVLKLQQRWLKWAGVPYLGQRTGRENKCLKEEGKTRSWSERLFYFHFYSFDLFKKSNKGEIWRVENSRRNCRQRWEISTNSFVLFPLWEYSSLILTAFPYL